jgi:phosphocarrier protein HPr
MRVHDITLTHDFTSNDLKRISLNAGRFHSDIVLLMQGAAIDVKSLLGMMLFPLKKGSVITIRTKGSDEEEALDFMCDNMESH